MTTPFSRFSEYFIAVAKTGSLRKAAEQLFISVSAVHRQIALAEEEMQVQLFERLPNGLKLTVAGELLYADLLRWQKDFQQTRIRFDELQGLHRGSIQFGMIAALTEGFVVKCMQHFQQDYPWLNFNIQVHESQLIAEKIIGNDLDFGLILDPKLQQNLDVLSFIEMPIGLVFSSQYQQLAAKKSVNLSDTQHLCHLLADAPLVIHERVDALYKKHQLQPEKNILCQDIRLLISLLQQNMGVAVLSLLDVYSQIESGELVFVPLKEKGIQPITIALCVAPKRQLSKSAKIFLQKLSQCMDEMKLQFHV